MKKKTNNLWFVSKKGQSEEFSPPHPANWFQLAKKKKKKNILVFLGASDSLKLIF